MLAHPKQRLFHEAAPKYRKRFFFGANQSGKTTAGLAEVLAHALGFRYWEIPDLRLSPSGDMPAREDVPIKHWVRRPDGLPIRVPNMGVVTTGLSRSRGIGENIWPRLHDFMPAMWRHQSKVMKGAMGVPEWVVFPNGSKVLFSSEEQDDFSFEGFIGDWWYCDEPVRQQIYNAMQARLIKNFGPQWFALTPLGARSAWMLPLYLEPPDDTFIVTVDQTDNPGLTDDQRREFAKNGEWTDRERDARLHGRFEVLGDRVIERYDPSVHLIPSFMPPEKWIHGLSVDPHHKRPAFMVWYAFDPVSRVFHCYREWPSDRDFFKCRAGGLSPGEYATLIRNVEGKFPARARICDPRFGKAEVSLHGIKQTSWVELMAQYGMAFDANVPNTGTIDYGHQVIDDLLRYDRNFPVGPTNTPHLFVHDCCKNLDKAIRNYGFLDVKDPVKGLYRKVSEEFKDPIDALRYALLYPLPATADQIDALQRFSEADLNRENEY